MHDRGCVAALEPRALRPARSMLAALLGACLGLTVSPGCGEARLGDNGDAGSGAPDGGSGGADAMSPLDPDRARSFEILADLTYTSTFPLPPEFLPQQHAFVLQVADGALASAIAGAAGEAVTGSFARAGDTLVLSGEIALPSDDGTSFLCSFNQVTYQGMTLETFDDNGDGAPDRVQGTATGSVSSFGDLGGGEFTAEITGSRDIAPPRLTLLGSNAPRSVLGDLVVQASEPLRPGLTVTAVLASGARVPLEARTGAGSSIVSFASPDDLLLPFGGTVRLEVDPAVEDLAGNRGTLDTDSFQTIADPQDFPQDGFESQSSVSLSGDATLVAGVGNAAALAGTTSLLLEPGSSATLRIPLPDAATGSVTLQVRGLFPDQADRFLGGEVVLASPDAPAQVRVAFPDAAGLTVPTGHAELGLCRQRRAAERSAAGRRRGRGRGGAAHAPALVQR